MRAAALCAAALPGAGVAADAVRPPPLEPEVSDVTTLPPAGPYRFLALPRNRDAIISDGETGGIAGQIPMAPKSNLRSAVDGSRFYVAETIWTHGNRGTRVDLLSIYDARTLTLQKEVELPGRLLVVNKLQDLELNAAGTRAYIYTLHPSSSVTWVDLARQSVGGTVETPGCALVFPWGDSGFASLCGDGSMAVVSVPATGPARITHTKPFFDAGTDPLFDNSLGDRSTGRAVFLSYTGLIYSATLGPDPVIEKPWSIQVAAGQPPAGTGNEELAWRPGGGQPFAWHKASERLFVLMHPGDYWTQREGGTEIWVLSRRTHALLARFAAPGGEASSDDGPSRSVSVSQDDHPRLFLLHSSGAAVTVMDADTGEMLRKVDAGGADAILVPGA